MSVLWLVGVLQNIGHYLMGVKEKAIKVKEDLTCFDVNELIHVIELLEADEKWSVLI